MHTLAVVLHTQVMLVHAWAMQGCALGMMVHTKGIQAAAGVVVAASFRPRDVEMLVKRLVA